jgi:hypothetical protein
MNVFIIDMGTRLFARFMPHAYALLLLQRDGISCVFFGDCTVSLVRFPSRQRALVNFLISCLRGSCTRMVCKWITTSGATVSAGRGRAI